MTPLLARRCNGSLLKFRGWYKSARASPAKTYRRQGVHPQGLFGVHRFDAQAADDTGLVRVEGPARRQMGQMPADRAIDQQPTEKTFADRRSAGRRPHLAGVN